MKKTVTIEIDADAYEHLRGTDCTAGKFEPCGFSEHVVNAVFQAVNAPSEAIHKSDCATNNGPAMPEGLCSCEVGALAHLDAIGALASAIRLDWSDPRSECREIWDHINAAKVALTKGE